MTDHALDIVIVLLALTAVVLAVWRRPNIVQSNGDKYITESQIPEAEEWDDDFIPSEADLPEPDDDDGEDWKRGRRSDR